MNFSVGKQTLNLKDVNIGIAPGRFDAKQVVLTALAVMNFTAEKKHLHILRTVNKKELEKCSFFITDGFAKKFPNIPSFNNIAKVWDRYGEFICSKVVYSANPCMTAEYASKQICEIEKYDILLEYNVTLVSDESDDVNFKNAVETAITLITQVIKSAALQAKSYYTIMNYIDECEGNVLYIPFNMNAKQIILDKASHIKWVITKESDNIYIIESIDKTVDIRQVVKDREEVIYAGRFFCKVTSYEVAKNLIEVIEAKILKIA